MGPISIGQNHNKGATTIPETVTTLIKNQKVVTRFKRQKETRNELAFLVERKDVSVIIVTCMVIMPANVICEQLASPENIKEMEKESSMEMATWSISWHMLESTLPIDLS